MFAVGVQQLASVSVKCPCEHLHVYSVQCKYCDIKRHRMVIKGESDGFISGRDLFQGVVYC